MVGQRKPVLPPPQQAGGATPISTPQRYPPAPYAATPASGGWGEGGAAIDWQRTPLTGSTGFTRCGDSYTVTLKTQPYVWLLSPQPPTMVLLHALHTTHMFDNLHLTAAVTPHPCLVLTWYRLAFGPAPCCSRPRRPSPRSAFSTGLGATTVATPQQLQSFLDRLAPDSQAPPPTTPGGTPGYGGGGEFEFTPGSAYGAGYGDYGSGSYGAMGMDVHDGAPSPALPVGDIPKYMSSWVGGSSDVTLVCHLDGGRADGCW